MTEPDKNNVQVVVLGNGFGECILVHIGGGKWIIVDSFRIKKNAQPASIEYLSSIGVDVEKNVSAIIATHWHNDHIQGMNETIKVCKSAQIAVSAVLDKNEFFAIGEFAQEFYPDFDFGTQEYFDCDKTLENSSREPFFAIQGRPFKIPTEQITHGERVEILPLSPTDFQFKNFLKNAKKFATTTSNQSEPFSKLAGTFLSRKRNNLSVVTLIKIGSNSILLGADMEEKKSQKYGWKNILEYQQYEEPRPFLFKVPHHGSIGAHSEPLWKGYIAKKPISVVTTFSRSRLPHKKGKELLIKHSKRTFITGTRLSNIKNTEQEMATRQQFYVESNIAPESSKFGTVAITFNAKSKVNTSNLNYDKNLIIECFGNAEELLKN